MLRTLIKSINLILYIFARKTMALIPTATNNLYDTYSNELVNGRRRRAENYENTEVRALAQMVRLHAAYIAGDQVEAAAAIAELEVIFGVTFTPPTNIISTSPTELNTRLGVEVSLTAGNNTITFSSAMPVDTYALMFNVYGATGGQVQWTQDPATRTVNGFEINVAANCKMDYYAAI